MEPTVTTVPHPRNISPIYANVSFLDFGFHHANVLNIFFRRFGGQSWGISREGASMENSRLAASLLLG